jgi:superfamily II DNA/RNA helicase
MKFNEELVKEIQETGLEKLSPIQHQVVVPIVEGGCVIVVFNIGAGNHEHCQ